jgi:protein TonB
MAAAVSPPRPVSEVSPVVTAMMKSLLWRTVTVNLKVSIDETGRVVKIEPLRTGAHQMLVDSAINAARKWKFSPARRGNAPIPSETTLQFTFDPSR